jgi:hypothetical protein
MVEYSTRCSVPLLILIWTIDNNNEIIIEYEKMTGVKNERKTLLTGNSICRHTLGLVSI